MAKKGNFDRVRRMGLALPGAEEGTTYGSPALKVGGKMFACIAIHRSAEPDSLVVRVDFDQRDALIADAPDLYYLTYHYVDYPVVLVRLNRVGDDALRDLLRTAWQIVSTSAKRRSAPRPRGSPSRARTAPALTAPRSARVERSRHRRRP